MIKWLTASNREQVSPEVTVKETLDELEQYEEGRWFVESMRYHLAQETDEIKKLTRDEKILILWLRKCGHKREMEEKAERSLPVVY